jgi:hypothetical protein
MTEFNMVASLDGHVIKGLDLPVVVVDEDFFEFLAEESFDSETGLDIVDFALFYEEWEKQHVAR